MALEKKSFAVYLKQARQYGIGEFLEIISEMSQESMKQGLLDRKTKELITLGISLHKRCNRCINIHTAAALKAGASQNELETVRKTVLFMDAVPHSHAELWGTWEQAWREFARSRGDMSHSARELVALAIAIIKQHEGSIRLHVSCARDFSISPEQIFEVVPITLLMDGAPAMSQIPRIVEAVELAFV